MNNLQPASLGKRLLAIFYDVLIIFFFTFIITLVAQQLIIQLEWISLEQVQITSEGEEINVIPSDSFVSFLLKNTWFFVSFFYFGHYWTKQGQTLGMRAWKIRVIHHQNGKNISWSQAIKRYVFALLGLGLLWMLFNKQHRALQDILSQSALIKVV